MATIFVKSASPASDARPIDAALPEGHVRWELLAWIVLLAIHLTPVWAFKYFPTDDGPSHLYNSAVLREYSLPDRALLRDFYTINRRPDPNWTDHLLLASLMSVVSPISAEKILLTSYLLLFPLAIRYALGAFGRAAAAMSFLAFPLIYNFTLQKGFYNFSLSEAGFFFAIAYWIRHENRFRLRHCAVLALIALATYFCHLVSMAMAAGAIGVLATMRTLNDREPGGLRRIFLPMAAFLPGFALGALFVGRHAGASTKFAMKAKIVKLILIYSLVLFDHREVIASAALAAIFAIAIVVALRRISRIGRGTWDLPFAALFLATIVVFFLTPDELAGGGLMNDRLSLFPIFILILWLGMQPWKLASRRLLAGSVVTISMAMLLFHMARIAQLNSYLSEYASAASVIPSGCTVLPIALADTVTAPNGQRVSSRIFPLEHPAGLIATGRGIVDLANYEASTGYFPIVYRPGRNSWTLIGLKHDLDMPPPVDFATFFQRTGHQIDYVILWRGRPDVPSAAAPLFQQLADYQKIYVSPERGYVEVYRRKDAQP